MWLKQMQLFQNLLVLFNSVTLHFAENKIKSVYIFEKYLLWLKRFQPQEFEFGKQHLVFLFHFAQ